MKNYELKDYEKVIFDDLFESSGKEELIPGGASGFNIFRVSGKLRRRGYGDNYVVKIGNATEAKIEFQNYEKYVKPYGDPPYPSFVAVVDQSSISGRYMGIVYRDAKDFLVSNVVTFEKFWGHQSRGILPPINILLNQIIAFYKRTIKDKTRPFRSYYTNVLPPDLKIEWDETNSSDVEEYSLEDLIRMANTPGEAEKLHGKLIKCNAKFTPDKGRLNSDVFPCKIDVSGLPSSQNSFSQIIGKVYSTRIGFLVDKFTKVFSKIDWLKEEFTLNGFALPNPLFALNDILDGDYSFRTAVIHGDLNVGNILVGNRYSNPQCVLIDYAKMGEFHAPFDFIKLEVELRTHLLGMDKYLNPAKLLDFELDLLYTSLGENELDENEIEKLYHHTLLQRTFMLIRDLRARARNLSKDGNMNDYFAGLFCYALATLKFNLDDNPLQKQSAIIAASVAAAHLLGKSEDLLSARKKKRDKQLKKDDYENIFLANIGDSDLQILPGLVVDEYRELSQEDRRSLDSIYRNAQALRNWQPSLKLKETPRQDGNNIRKNYDWFKDKLVAPILKPALTEVLSRLGIGRPSHEVSISLTYLFATNQRSRHPRDTIHFAILIRDLIKDNLLAEPDLSTLPDEILLTYDRIEQIKIEQIQDAPSSYDDMRKYFRRTLSDLYKSHPEIKTVYICLSGGAPASNFALLQNALQIWRENCIPIYVNQPENGEVYGTALALSEFSKDLHKSFLMNSIKTLLDKGKYDSILLLVGHRGDGFVMVCRAMVALQCHKYKEAVQLLSEAEKVIATDLVPQVQSLEANINQPDVLKLLDQIIKHEFDHSFSQSDR